ncbi:hypothetical protein DW095_02185 [Bacteroides sp. AM07-16]|nr:hypothetical protein DW095_02185 [Bacteroides sp. AM07-16]
MNICITKVNKNIMDRNKLRKMLPQGSLKEVAKEANVSRSAVTSYFKGRNNSYKIEIAAMTIAKIYEIRRRTLSNELLEP